MSDFIISSTSIKGSFEVIQDQAILYVVSYKNWFAEEATTSYRRNNYVIKSPNFWQSQFDVYRNDQLIGKLSFNWKGQIVISYQYESEKQYELLFQYKGVWKARFILSDRSGKELLAMVASWSFTKYHYDVSVADDTFQETERNELLMMCGYAANLFMTTMMAGT